MNSIILLAVSTVTMGFSPPAVSSTAQVFDRDSRLLAEARFDARSDSFAVTKQAGSDGRAYLEYRYLRTDGTLQTGTHAASREPGETVRFPHDFTAGRTVTFRVCVSGEHAFNACSAGADGENWTVGIA
ncbi:hypothetical protein [Actinoplanes sp. L3-i22]|uniref:hypothetical protein n=1 Tax=Actinoplanes sp. L3-i22 TaxID=2836373 RepID=UPI001C7796D0|nr:hypothetical protein [Actinoplanes sp. L3-i22]BCY10440.1 hypothetical protein L3i22_055280 [Actinoplanes sp. L3-i22]